VSHIHSGCGLSLELCAALSSASKRYQLAVESPSFSALQSVWEMVVNNAILAAQRIHEKRREGMSIEDITVTLQIIQLCDQKSCDEVYAVAATHPATPPEFSQYRDAFLLGSKTIRQVLNFCIDLLDDERACEKAENQILRVVATLVAQKAYVRSFKSESEMQILLEEMESRILPKDLGSSGFDVRIRAAEVFRNLLRTATQEVGMDMALSVASAVKLVATCAEGLNDTRADHFLCLPLIEGISFLMRANPEQIVAPMRRHGAWILRYAKMIYRSITDRRQRGIVHEYFLCHL
jgi:hypothetical protein